MKTTAIFAICIIMYSIAWGQNQDEETNPKEKVIQLSTTTSEFPPKISFKWNPIPGHISIKIFRKMINADSWGDPIATLPTSATEFTDDNVEAGIEYEYAIKAGYVMQIETYANAGIKCKEVESRGKIILLVDSNIAIDLQEELRLYESDLVGDGWEILRKDIPGNTSVTDVKSIIRNFYNSDPENVNSVFLIGHIPVPYSGNDAYDGHYEDHKGAWPADMYYGSMNETIWKDKFPHTTSASRPENKNIPGDGKFDLNSLPVNEKITLSVGRVDFYNLPAFPQSETELLRNYLKKNHAFRHKIINPKMQGLVDDNFKILYHNGVREAFSVSGWRNFSALLNFQNVKTGRFFSETKDDSYIWSYGCGGGKFDSCAHIGSTSSFVNQSPKTVFTAFYGSRFGDWDSQNNFMRAALASNGWILTCSWAGRPQYTFHQMGMGATIGECVRATQNNDTYFYYSGTKNRCIHISLLGDPTLRMHIVSPANSLKSTIRNNQKIALSWNPSNGNIIGYYVYKLDTITNSYYRLTENPVTESYFEDNSPAVGNNYYMVRSLELTKSVSGSYFNLSQGIFDTLHYEQKTSVSSDIVTTEMQIYPNPANDKLHIKVPAQFQNEFDVKMFTITGKMIFHKAGYIEQIDISGIPTGVYLISLKSKDIVSTQKIIKR